tara:strand:+ start:270 stop:548 length:279 start_codon:yes stop_codon:yes gene_type:complete
MSNQQIPQNPEDPAYLQLPYEQKKVYLQQFLRQEIYDFEYHNGIPDQEDLDVLDEDLSDSVIEAVQDYATDISESYSALIIKYIELMVEARQ